MAELAGNTRISLEGHLSSCQFENLSAVSHVETAILKRNTLVPKLDFVVAMLSPEMVEPVFDQVMKAGLTDNIIHVQIERNGALELGAYDNFHPECVVTGSGVSTALLDELKDKKIIREYQIATPTQ